MTIYKGLSLVTSFYSHDIIHVLFYWIIKQDYKKKNLVTRDWSQSILLHIRDNKTESRDFVILCALFSKGNHLDFYFTFEFLK